MSRTPEEKRRAFSLARQHLSAIMADKELATLRHAAQTQVLFDYRVWSPEWLKRGTKNDCATYSRLHKNIRDALDRCVFDWKPGMDYANIDVAWIPRFLDEGFVFEFDIDPQREMFDEDLNTLRISFRA